MDAELLEILACPDTHHAPLTYDPKAQNLTCTQCARIFPIRDGIPVLLLDEAYCDTAPVGTVPAIDTSNPQVLRLRTFSKAYGLAGARIGYCVGEAGMISAFEKVRNHAMQWLSLRVRARPQVP